MPPSHKRGVFRTFVHRKKTSPREVESLYHKKTPLVNSCGRFFRIFRRPAEERRAGRENLRRDTPPMSPAAQRRERRMPQVPADAFPRRAIMSVPGYAENLPFSRRRWRGAGISANYFVICVVKTTEFGFSETKLSVRCAAADGFTRRRRSVRQTEKKPRR